MKKLLIVLAVLVLAAPTMAAEWNFYGQARFGTWSVDKDYDVPGVGSDRETLWSQQSNSRIGATVKFNDEIGGAFEMSDSFGKRKLYGTYNFGAGQLLIGQDYTPASSYFYSTSTFDTDGNLLGVGQFYVGRVPMIQLTFGNLKLAFVEPNTEGMLMSGFFTPVAGTPNYTFNYIDSGETTLPKIELSYGYKGEMFFVDLFGGYQTYEINNPAVGPATPILEEDIDSYVVGIGGGVTVGPVWFNAGFHMGENLGSYGMYNPMFFDDPNLFNTGYGINPVTGKIEDQEGMGYIAVLGFKANDMLKFELGYGRQETEIDNMIAQGVTYEADLTQYYLNATINITKGFFMVPEIGMIENSVDGYAPEPELFYLGAKWQINF
jgi:hypothetical protein